MLSPKRQNFAVCQSAHAAAARAHAPSFSCVDFSCQKPTTTLRFKRIRLQMKPCSRSPCAAWFMFMKSMSIVAHGMSRLYCVCRCATGLRSCLRPLIHIFDGENVWHQVMRPMHLAALFAAWQSAVTASGETMTGLKTTFTGIAGATLSALAISCECSATFFRVSGP